VKLLVFEKNPAIRLYERLGFRRTSSVATPKIARAFGEAYDVLIRMERPI
jgi:ribosomal protein S18 acetylase RimI-like enzyme